MGQTCPQDRCGKVSAGPVLLHPQRYNYGPHDPEALGAFTPTHYGSKGLIVIGILQP
ncbi:hypothetical protein [Arthrobacter sp. OV608]|uniref:hypothetical protein n=1 Tax=Arthrobacter sp. OV608 TaxID=1882768 RepID=UPI0025707AA5|nr:hypothetical protein [Arthrobacter sp. OV608]